MWIRMRFCIRWLDIAYGLAASIWPAWLVRKTGLMQRTVSKWPDNEQLIPCLSVRTGFDLLLKSLQLPADSRILLTALTVSDMQTIVEHHGLTAVPIDLQPNGFRPDLTAFENAITPKTRMIVVAHLFGDRIPMQPILQIARQHNLLVVEDCAQSFSGLTGQSHDESDVVMFSFGPIKTCSSLQGAIVRVRNAQVRQLMQQIHSTYEPASRIAYIRRLVRYSFLKLMTNRIMFRMLVTVCGLLRVDYDTVIGKSSTNFSAGRLFEQLRKQPSAGLLRIMARRFDKIPSERIDRRIQLGLRFDSHIKRHRPDDDVYWVYPIVVDQPSQAVGQLRAAGFDATCQSRLAIVDSNDQNRTRHISTTWNNTIFLPWYPELAEADVLKMAEIVQPFLSHVDRVDG